MTSTALIERITEETNERTQKTKEKPIKDETLEKRIATEQGKRIVIVSPYAIVNGFLAAEIQNLLINPKIDIIRYARLVNLPYINVQELEETHPEPFLVLDFKSIISVYGHPIEFNEYREWAKTNEIPCLVPKEKIKKELGNPRLKEKANHIHDFLKKASVQAIQHDLREASVYNFNSLQAFSLL